MGIAKRVYHTVKYVHLRSKYVKCSNGVNSKHYGLKSDAYRSIGGGYLCRDCGNERRSIEQRAS